MATFGTVQVVKNEIKQRHDPKFCPETWERPPTVASHFAQRWDIDVAPNDETATHRHNGQPSVTPWCTPSIQN